MHKSVQPALDDFDRKILAILQKDNMTPQRTIGEVVNLSAPAVQRRIKRMTEEGVIQANVASAGQRELTCNGFISGWRRQGITAASRSSMAFSCDRKIGDKNR